MIRVCMITVLILVGFSGDSLAQGESCPQGAWITIMVENDDSFVGPPVPTEPSLENELKKHPVWNNKQ